MEFRPARPRHRAGSPAGRPTPGTSPMKRDSPEDSLRFSGRDFSQQELAILRAWLAENTLCREHLARRVCQEFGWTNAAGKPQTMSCKVALLRMHRAGLIELPAPVHPDSRPAHRCGLALALRLQPRAVGDFCGVGALHRHLLPGGQLDRSRHDPGPRKTRKEPPASPPPKERPGLPSPKELPRHPRPLSPDPKGHRIFTAKTTQPLPITN